MRHCSYCECEIAYETEYRIANEEVICISCFDDNFNYCSNCDEVISNNNTYYLDDNAYCSECYENEHDDFPNNPFVDENDLKLVVHLSRKWLNDKENEKMKFTLNINQKDDFLHEVRSSAGLIDIPLYIYGLKDREEYQICASSNIVSKVKEYLEDHELITAVTETHDSFRLGVSLKLRQTNLKMIIDLINHLSKSTKIKHLESLQSGQLQRAS